MRVVVALFLSLCVRSSMKRERPRTQKNIVVLAYHTFFISFLAECGEISLNLSDLDSDSIRRLALSAFRRRNPGRKFGKIHSFSTGFSLFSFSTTKTHLSDAVRYVFLLYTPPWSDRLSLVSTHNRRKLQAA